ncbi:MAG: sugar ABC transporter permease [Oscillospiraceae bacterium]|nr:sugar ABC transporter permease [Oscillospiraceae bacterium]
MTNRKRIEGIQGYLFLSPALIIFFIFTVLAILFIIFLSFTKFNILNWNMVFVGFQNYIRAFTDPRFHIALFNVLKYAVVVVPIQTLFALLMAIALNAKIKFPTVFRTIFFLPTLTSSAALTIIFMFLFSVNGSLNQILLNLHILKEPISFLTNTKFTLVVIMVMNIWSTIPMYATIYIAGLKDISNEIYEAAEIDGANGFKKFIYLIVPIIAPITVFVVLTGTVGCLQLFDQAYIFSQGSGGPANSTLTVTLAIYQYAFQIPGSMGYASALAVILAMVIFAFALLTRKWQGQGGESS